MLARARLLVATAWAGSLWTVGYLAAPTLFGTLSDRVLAGTIAASLFHVQALVSIGCALLLLLLLWLDKSGVPGARRTTVALALAMLACTLVSHYGLQPEMAALRAAAGPGGVMESAAKGRFGMLHGISSSIYLFQSLLAAWLVVKQ
jgi:hypothetical protein